MTEICWENNVILGELFL